MSGLSVTHSTEAGTLVEGTARGDSSAPILKRHSFRWSRNLGAWFAPRSRYGIANRHRIEGLAADLRAAGFTVVIEIDNGPVSAAEREAHRTERAHERHEGLTAKAERKGSEAQLAFDRFRQELDVIPPGQPILVGHHSERRHRAALARADRAIARSAEADQERRSAQERARAALSEDQHRKSPVYIGNRIREREAEERGLVRRLDSHAFGMPPEGAYRDDLTARLAQVREDLEFYREQMAALEAAGLKLWEPGDFAKGDRVRYRNRWGTVERVNKVSLTVASDVMPQCPQRVPYTDVQAKGAAA